MNVNLGGCRCSPGYCSSGDVFIVLTLPPPLAAPAFAPSPSGVIARGLTVLSDQ